MSSKTNTTATRDEATPPKVPKLRFLEFRGTESWRKLKLGSAAFFYNGRAYKQEELLERGKYKVLRVGNFFTNNNWYYSDLELEDEKYCEEGDLLYAWSASFGPRVWREGKTIYHYHIWKVVQRGGVDKAFLFITLEYQTERMKARSANGLGLLHITKGTIESWEACFPNVSEQQKIAECLSSVDELMAAQARKVDALKTHKKGLMQQLFPREGETQPRLRFLEFQNAGEWREEKLINLSSEPLSNGVFNDPKKVGSGYKLINVSDMYIETTIDESRLTLLELSPSDFEANQAITGDIFFTRSSLVKSGIAVSNIYLGSSNNVTYDGHLIRFRPSTSKVIPLFAHYLFKTEPIRAQLIARGKTATMTTIGQADVASVTLFYPGKDEQQRIAGCLSSLDALVAAETRKLEALKTHKKGLMQQLFPSLEEGTA